MNINPEPNQPSPIEELMNRPTVPWSELDESSSSCITGQPINGMVAVTSSGTSVEVWDVDDDADPLVIALRHPLKDGRQSLLHFALSSEAAAILVSLLLHKRPDLLDAAITASEARSTGKA